MAPYHFYISSFFFFFNYVTHSLYLFYLLRVFPLQLVTDVDQNIKMNTCGSIQLKFYGWIIYLLNILGPYTNPMINI